MNIFKSKQNIAILRLTGTIAIGGRKNLSLPSLKNRIDNAFSKKNKAVALIVNSPGGSPAQSYAIATYIKQLSVEKKIPVYAFVEDVAASGGYWIALCANEIYALPSSIVGSIGVISSGFGFTELIKKYGIERRVYTAGNNKSTLDPFKEENPKDIERLKKLLTQLHVQFKNWVKDNRQSKLKADDETLFNGDFWLGEEAAELGLIDGLGDYKTILESKFGKKINYILIDEKKGWFSGILGTSSSNQFSLTTDVIESITEKSIWQKYGL